MVATETYGVEMGNGLAGFSNSSNSFAQAASYAAPPPPPAEDDPTSSYTFAGVLHHLQSEWRQYERERNEWDIERAEMRARIALLEGERASMENAKTDLMRRVKMLEFALRQERARYLVATSGVGPQQATTSSGAGADASGRNSPAGSAGSGPGSDTRSNSGSAPAGQAAPSSYHAGQPTDNTKPLPSIHAKLAGMLPSSRPLSARGSRPGSAAGFAPAAPGSGTSLGASTSLLITQKDPKSKARSREFMQQCLQEINYLTSTNALNPLPDRGVESLVGITSAQQLSQAPQRPRRVMDDSREVNDEEAPTTANGTDTDHAAGSEPRTNELAPGSVQILSSNDPVVPFSGRNNAPPAPQLRPTTAENTSPVERPGRPNTPEQDESAWV